MAIGGLLGDRSLARSEAGGGRAAGSRAEPATRAVRRLTMAHSNPAPRCRAVNTVQRAFAGVFQMSVMERIQAEVDGHPIVLFMKGTPQFPMCGFSSRAVQALRDGRRQPVAHRQRAGGAGDPRQPAALLQLADVPAALHQWRADRRLRHHAGAVRVRRAGAHGQRDRSAADDGGHARTGRRRAARSQGRVVLVPARTAGLGAAAPSRARRRARPSCCWAARCRS